MSEEDELEIPEFLKRDPRAPYSYDEEAARRALAKMRGEPEELPELPPGLRWAQNQAEEDGFAMQNFVVPRRYARDNDVISRMAARAAYQATPAKEREPEKYAEFQARTAAIREEKKERNAAMRQTKRELREMSKRVRERRKQAPAAETQPAEPAQQKEKVVSANGKKKRARKENGGREVGKKPKAASAFRPVRAGTARATVATLSDGDHTVAQIAARIKGEAKTVMVHLYMLWRDCGIGYELKNEKPKLILPEGKRRSDLVAEPAAA